MLENVTIARIAGIPIRASLLLGYLLAFWAIAGAARGYAGLTMVLIVLSIALLLAHELGHAFVARRFGLQVVDIVLWPLGGMARITDMPENPRVEAWVAAAGPLVNLVLAVAALPLLLVGSAPPTFTIDLPGATVPVAAGAQGAVTLFVLINIAYGVFNLLPAFPMDGGRLLRAFLARGGRSWVEATDRATSIGSVLAWALILMSLLQGACFMSIIGLFVLWAGLRERWAVRLKHHAEAYGGSRGRMAGWEALMRQAQAARGGGAAGPFRADGVGPGVDGGGMGAEGGGAGAPPNDIGSAGDGFSDEDIERLESFRGRLQKPNPEAEG
ncbi:MAG: site-2 protease family protein [Planctomycetota bacterium]